MVLFYHFIFQKKLSEGWNYCLNAIGFFAIIGILYYVIVPTIPFMTSTSPFNLRVEGLTTSGHFLTVLPVWIFALLISIKYKNSFIGLLTTAAFVAIHETIFTIVYEINGFAIGRGAELILAAQSFIPSNFFFACVLIVWIKYYMKEVLELKYFFLFLGLYIFALIYWVTLGFHLTIDSFSGVTQYYSDIGINSMEDLTWFIPLSGLFVAMFLKNPDIPILRNLKSIKTQLRQIYFEIKN